MIILSLHTGRHDGTAALFDGYRLRAAVQLERLTRLKGDGGGIPRPAMDEVLDIAGLTPGQVDAVVLSRASFPARLCRLPAHKRLADRLGRALKGEDKLRDLVSLQRRFGQPDAARLIDGARLKAELGLRAEVPLFFSNHHLAHALSAFFYTDWDDALLYTADGCGDNVHYSARVVRDGRLDTLFGDDAELLAPRRVDSLGLAYGYMTQALGFRMNRHEGKLTGLAAFGQPTLLDELAAHFRVEDTGRVASDFASDAAMRAEIARLAASTAREDAAASIQQLLEDTVLASVRRLLELHPVRHLALAGGVFANVRLNRLLTEATGVRESFIFPGMGDEGITVGGALQFLLERDGLKTWLDHRHRLSDVYLGRDFDGEIDRVLAATPGVTRRPGPPADSAAELLAKGDIVAIYSGRMEFGPRALGARSILANPADRAVNDSLNARLTRTEFMPFAPVVAAEDAAEVFEITPANAYACRFMTITCGVKPQWHDRIPAVVHVDGTARPQIIDRDTNPLYFDILAAFKKHTGLPVLVNTSFNAHEEPIINTPQECRDALITNRVDHITTNTATYSRS
ncbi:carbamoyltransferase family protein [Roseospirillum parvum]|uniref:Carbamoyltransferase n=1 Tax=Roseospirillum parvum TaxID=83401 RepID=A0A1G7TTX1_9PROT|nr:carbamoyltransferase C-terminal domain-containing protein [Roseospirillum parvum]SDG38621.1 carbamoyltransferase [Roseospirillum parvum]